MNAHSRYAGCESKGAIGMAKQGVNLDALIPRADLAIGEGRALGVQGEERLGVTHFQDKTRNFFASKLRKPEFQRETTHWEPSKIYELVADFLDQRLVPAVILWRAGEFNFVVDGAHRISALLAWIHDDYGAGKFSQELFGSIPPEQQALADKTKALIEDKIGSFELYRAGLEYAGVVTDEQRTRISNLSVCHFVAQWVPASTKDAAEKSYFKINDSGTPLEPTERRILQSRNSANAIAARAIAHGGKGYEYWRAFEPATKKVIVETSGRLFDLLYKPPLSAGHINTLDVPVAGRGYSVLPFVFDFINAANETKIPDSTKGAAKNPKLEADPNGDKTVSYLKNVLRSTTRLTGDEPTSLGLHPVVYFYTGGGSFSPWSFLAWSKIINNRFAQDSIEEFTVIRASLEEFLRKDKWAMTEIIHKNGSGYRSTPWLEKYWTLLLSWFAAGMTGEEVREKLKADKAFAFLQHKSPHYRLPGESSRKAFSRATRTATVWEAALPGAPTCYICSARVHRNSAHTEHKQDIALGGDARPSNAGLAHPYCDSNKHRLRELIARAKERLATKTG